MKEFLILENNEAYVIDQSKYYPHAVNTEISRQVMDPATKQMVHKTIHKPVLVHSILEHKDKFPEDFEKFQREVGTTPPPDHERMLAEERIRTNKLLADQQASFEKALDAERKVGINAVSEERKRVKQILKDSTGIPLEHRKAILEALTSGVPVVAPKDEAEQEAATAAK